MIIGSICIQQLKSIKNVQLGISQKNFMSYETNFAMRAKNLQNQAQSVITLLKIRMQEKQK